MSKTIGELTPASGPTYITSTDLIPIQRAGLTYNANVAIGTNPNNLVQLDISGDLPSINIGVNGMVIDPSIPGSGNLNSALANLNNKITSTYTASGGITRSGNNFTLTTVGATTNQFLTSVDGSGNLVKAQPAFTNISGTIATTQLPGGGTNGVSELLQLDASGYTPLANLPNGGVNGNSQLVQLNASGQLPAVNSGVNTTVTNPTTGTSSTLNTALASLLPKVKRYSSGNEIYVLVGVYNGTSWGVTITGQTAVSVTSATTATSNINTSTTLGLTMSGAGAGTATLGSGISGSATTSGSFPTTTTNLQVFGNWSASITGTVFLYFSINLLASALT